MSILLLAEHDNAALKAATLNVVSAAIAIGGDIHILVAGQNCRPAAEEAAKIPGVAKILVADDAAYGHGLAENVAPLIVTLVRDGGYSHVLAPSTTSGKNIAPRGFPPVAGIPVRGFSGRAQ